jgi:predicted enzyme related to lactoylglutathione lyase
MSMNNTLCWVDIPVLDLDRAIRFYSAILATAVSKQSAGPGFEFGLLPHSENNVSGCLCRPDERQSALRTGCVNLSQRGGTAR